MRLLWCLAVVAFARPATANMPQLPAHYAALFEHAHHWTYDVATTIYDIEDFHKARPPKKTMHTTVVCKVAHVSGFRHGAASRIECDGDPDAGYPLAGDYGATEDGLYRLSRFPKSEAELAESLGEQIVGAKPHVWRKRVDHAVRGLREDAHSGWCAFEDTTQSSDGATRSQCFKAGVGIASGDYDGGGENWRRVSYQLKHQR